MRLDAINFLLVLPWSTFVHRAPAAAAKAFERGYVTAIRSASDFDLNGYRVIFTAKTAIRYHAEANPSQTVPDIQPFLGQFMEVDGDLDRYAGTLKATKIEVLPPPNREVKGVGIIDDRPTTDDTPDTKVVRADGYVLILPSKADISFTAPVTAASPLTTNLWIRYRGHQSEDGTVMVDQAEISANTVNHNEYKLRTKSDFDPAAIDEGDKQSGVSKAFFGVDRKRIPAWKDAAMQARIEKIGESLVPAYQKALPLADPTRIDFRFQVVDFQKLKDAMSMGSGIILIPYQIVERLENDSQVASILADSIAEVLEKQDFRAKPAQHKMTAVNILGDAAGVIVPGARIATGIGTYATGKNIKAHQTQQSSRVSLWLMHDAGYDIAQAPLAWWRLQAKKDQNFTRAEIPEHSLFLYENLGTTWHKNTDLLLKSGTK